MVIIVAIFLFLFPVILLVIGWFPIFLYLKNRKYKNWPIYIFSGALFSGFIVLVFFLSIYGITKKYPGYFITFGLALCISWSLLAFISWFLGIRTKSND